MFVFAFMSVRACVLTSSALVVYASILLNGLQEMREIRITCREWMDGIKGRKEGDRLISISECMSMSGSTGVIRLHDPLATLRLRVTGLFKEYKSPVSVADISGRIKVRTVYLDTKVEEGQCESTDR